MALDEGMLAYFRETNDELTGEMSRVSGFPGPRR